LEMYHFIAEKNLVLVLLFYLLIAFILVSLDSYSSFKISGMDFKTMLFPRVCRWRFLVS
jgi:hypothetical protein